MCHHYNSTWEAAVLAQGTCAVAASSALHLTSVQVLYQLVLRSDHLRWQADQPKPCQCRAQQRLLPGSLKLCSCELQDSICLFCSTLTLFTQVQLILLSKSSVLSTLPLHQLFPQLDLSKQPAPQLNLVLQLSGTKQNYKLFGIFPPLPPLQPFSHFIQVSIPLTKFTGSNFSIKVIWNDFLHR